MIDADKIRLQIRRAIADAGSTPWLYGYDVVGIQEFIVARDRPKAMSGASNMIVRFDENSWANIFAGGGRGIGLAGSEQAAQQRCRDLTNQYQGLGGVLAAGYVRYDESSPSSSLAYLRAKLEQAKDAAPPPPGELPSGKQDQCETCSRFRATVPVQRGNVTERVCTLCASALQYADDPQMSQSLADLSPCHLIAAVSADGNGMGVFFDSLQKLEEVAAASQAVSQIFQQAHKEAAKILQEKKIPFVPLINGGDDIRLFLAAEGLLDYVPAFVRGVEQGAERAGNLGGLLSPQSAAFLRQLGVGVGAVVAEDHYPASLLMEHAHALEDSAKAICRSASMRADSRKARSAFDLEVLTAANAFAEGLQKRAEADNRPWDMDAQSVDLNSWKCTLDCVKALLCVPAAQRSILSQAQDMPLPEFMNLFRYQVARHHSWQKYYDALYQKWTDPDSLARYRPGPGHLALLRVVERAA